MKLLILSGVIITLGIMVSCEICYIVRQCFERDQLVPPPVQARFIGFDSIYDDLYFVYWSNNLSDPLNDKIVKVNVNSKELTTIPVQVGLGYATAFNHVDREIYIGHIGISKYNLDTNTTTFYAANNTRITDMFYKDNLYYRRRDVNWFVIKNGTSQEVFDLRGAWNVVIDNNGYQFSTSSKGLRVQNGWTESSNEYSVSSLALDPNGKLYANVFNDGVYTVEKIKLRFVKLFDLPEAVSIMFDAYSNIIFDERNGGVYRLKARGTC